MATRSWNRRKLARSRGAAAKTPNQRRPRIEALEDRRLLAITVDTLVDEADGSIVDGDISLRDAIAASPAGGTIDFSVTGTISLALGEVVVQDRILQGPGAAQLTIDAHGASNVFTTRGTTTLSGLTITGGGATLRGGGIRNESVFGNEGHLTVASSVVTGNTALLQGGGIHGGGYTLVYGSVTVVNSTISGNQALKLNDDYGQGGGIYTAYADVTVDKSTISGNFADRFGGGIYGGVTMTNSTVTGNKASNLVDFSEGGGIFVRGPLSIVNSTISGNIGTGIRFIQGGGGVVANSTVSNNGFGIAAYGGVTLLNTIVAGNGGLLKNGDITGTVDVSGSRNNLIGSSRNLGHENSGINGPPAGGLTNGVNGNIVDVADAGLRPLANNGGPTQTHALFSFSPAINRGDNSLVPINPSTGLPFTVDQIGAARIFGGGAVDMGAVEFQATPFPSTVVNTVTDDVAGNALTSLREAIGFAFTLGGPVTFDPTVFATPKTISLVHGQITVDGRSAPLVLNGPGRALATVDGEDAPVVFKTYGATTISGLTITGAKKIVLLPESSSSYSGAIHNKGTLTISGCAVSDNQTRGIFNDFVLGEVNVVDSIISGNSALSGAGIFNTDTLLPRLISISNSVISGNTATGFGGGLYSNGAVTIANSTISGNSAASGGGIFQGSGDASTLSIVGTYIHHNSATAGGGGIRRNGGTVTIVNSTIASNTAGGGGGLAGSGATIINSTISGNTAGSGGGISGDLQMIINSTIANNTASTAGEGGGLDGTDSTVANSIIAGNTAGGAPSDVVGPFGLNAASSYNLIGDAATAGGLMNGTGGNIVGVNPALVLGPLAGNGGPTLPSGESLPTHALLAGSPAIDAGDPFFNPVAAELPFDQRGSGFARVARGTAGATSDYVGLAEIKFGSTMGDVITPTAVFANTYYSGGQGPTNLINNSGLNTSSGNVLTYTHAADPNAFGMWHAGAGQGVFGEAPLVADQYIVLDLGASYDLSKAYLWQMVQTNLLARGIKEFRLLASPAAPNPGDVANPPAVYDLTGFTEVLGVTQLAANPQGGAAPTQAFDLAGATGVRQIYIEFVSSYNTGTRVDIGAFEAPLYGDYDLDGDADGNDFLVWQRQLGWTATPKGSGADGNGDGTVDGADLAVWRNHFGAAPAVAAAVPAVAEAVVAEDHAATVSKETVNDAALAALAQAETGFRRRAILTRAVRLAARPLQRATYESVTFATTDAGAFVTTRRESHDKTDAVFDEMLEDADDGLGSDLGK